MTRAGGTYFWGITGAAAFHVVVLAGLFSAEPPAVRFKKDFKPPVRVTLAARPAPPAAEALKPPAPQAEELRPREAPRPKAEKPPARPAAPEPKAPAPEPPGPVEPTAPPPAAEPPKARKFTVAMDAVVPGGGVAVPTGEGGTWAGGRPDGAADGDRVLGAPPGGAGKAAAAAAPARPVEAAQASRPPRLLSQPDPAALRSAYPGEARVKGLEADISLRILVGADGRVKEARVVRPVGNGFDEAATALVKRFTFAPGEKDGAPAAVWISWTYKFRLDG